MNTPNECKTMINSVNPATNEVLKSYELMTDEQIENILEKAHEAFKQWKGTCIRERGNLLRNVASVIKEQKEELAKLATLEMGKLYKEALGEVMLCAEICEYYAENGEQFLADETLETPSGKAIVTYEPLGVILSIQPWNFPYYQIIRSAAPHIMAGNTFVLKHSHNVPQCAEAVERVFREAGAPEGVYTNVFMNGAQASEAISNKYVRGVTFTGSESAGSKVAAEAGKWVKKSVLELGGNDPLIILDDMDLDKAVEIAVKGRLANAGQVCTSPKRVIVMQSVANQFLQKAQQKMKALKVGDPFDPQTELGPLVDAKAINKIITQLNYSVSDGARVLCGGRRMDCNGAFMEPTIVTHIVPRSVAYQEEIFGPVLLVFHVNNEEEAIELANDTAYGLGATILTADEERGMRVARQINSGMVFINQVTTSSPELPFGGIKNSGYGRELSKAGIREFVNAKLIRIGTGEEGY